MFKLQETYWIRWNAASIFPLVIAAILLIGCSTPAVQVTATEDTAYLTPIPRETLQAYQWDTPVRNKMDAVIHARLSLDTTRLSYAEEPKVVLAEEMRLEDARKHIVQPAVINTDEDQPGDMKVWLVIFEGEWQTIVPLPAGTEHPVTPEPVPYGCVYVIIAQNDSSYSEIGTTECSP